MPSDATANYSNDDALDWMQKIQSQKRLCDTENAVLRTIYKGCKAAGHNVGAIRRAIRNAREDSDTVVRTYRDEIRYSGLRRIPLTPETLFAGMDFAVTEKTQESTDIWDAEQQGYIAGRAGAAIDDCPFNPGTEQHVAWLAWLGKGKAAKERELGPNATVAPATRTRPRRRQPQLPLGEEPPAAARKKQAARKKAARAPRRTIRRTRQPATAPENGATVY